MKVSPLAVLAALLIVGVSVEVVENQNRSAAYALVVLILLGIITFNAQAFKTEVGYIFAYLSAPSKASGNSGQSSTSATATPFLNK